MASELDLRDIFGVLTRRLWILLVVPVLTALVAGAVSFYVLTPVYSASTTLWVMNEGSQINYENLLTSRNLTKTYAEVAQSRAVMSDVARQLNLGETALTALEKKLTVTPVRDTEILSFAVEDSDPVMAANIANAVADAFKAQVRSYMKIQNVMIVDRAVPPLDPIRPRPLLNIAVAAVLGVLLAVGLVFLIEALDTSIKSADDVTRHLGVPVLGMIPVIDQRVQEASPRRSRATRSNKTRPVVGE